MDKLDGIGEITPENSFAIPAILSPSPLGYDEGFSPVS
tara:strand:- start:333 stop:446 length:114 start_codon:yes stop_codon:yes gene_type:complete